MPSLNYAAINGLMDDDHGGPIDPYRQPEYVPHFRAQEYHQAEHQYECSQEHAKMEGTEHRMMMPHSDSSVMAGTRLDSVC